MMKIYVAILILLESFLQLIEKNSCFSFIFIVAILILLESFLQCLFVPGSNCFLQCRNPYFIGILSAMNQTPSSRSKNYHVAILILLESFLQ